MAWNLYSSNVFDYFNIPASGDLLIYNSTRYIQADNMAPLVDDQIMQRRIRLKVTNIDYAARVNFAYNDAVKYWYDILSFNILNNNVVEFEIQFNPFLSYGYFQGATESGKDSTINGHYFGTITGTATRLTPEDPEAMDNMLPEDWGPSRPFRHVPKNEGKYNSDTYIFQGFPEMPQQVQNYDFIAVTVDPGSAKAANDIIVNYNEKSALTSYTIKPRAIKLASGSLIRVYNPALQGPRSYGLPNIGIYMARVRTSVNEYLNYLNSLGLNSAIVARWVVPYDYAEPYEYDDDTTETGYIRTLQNPDSLRGRKLVGGLYDLYHNSTKDNATPVIYNAKALYYYANVRVTGATSGDAKTWRLIDIVPSKNVNSKFDFRLMANPSYNGRPYLLSRYHNFKNITLTGIDPQYIVSGSQWLSPLLALEGKSGQTLADYQAGENIKQAQRGAAANIGTGLLDTAAGILTGNMAGAASGAVNTIASGISGARNISQAKNARNISDAVYTPATYGTTDMPDLAEVSGNNFLVDISGLDVDDLQEFDKYLTLYGYADNKIIYSETQLKTYARTRGEYFCYIRIPDARLQVPSGTNKAIADIVESRLADGVRIWKKVPQRGYNSSMPNNSKKAITLTQEEN